jgi:acetyl/propionyl-CoA carboxylase alpha subunit
VGEGPPFRLVLIANRGEIALRIIRACRELGVESIAVFSDADVESPHVRAADLAARIGSAPAVDSYLRADRILEAALELGAEAIHPGYGFLAERASFAAAVEAAGLVFVGPSSETIARLGDKLAARRLAREVGVPVVPGTLEALAVDRVDALPALVEEATCVGYPLLVKASAGGGGRGMRRVERPADLPAALAAGSAEARSAFGDGSVYLEHVIQPARHVEVQLIGDRAGTIVALGERDCSVQRRHQKLVEESPAPDLSAAERAALHDAAVRLGRAAGLTNAATVEFLLDGERQPWFLEVNTRLQVEHGVTEQVADVDIVREQLRVAAGRPLSSRTRSAAASAARPIRHAIEVRLSAEDPGLAFAPAPGRVGRWSMPSGPGVRVDTAIEPRAAIPSDYDPLLAKIIVVDEDRPRAIERMARALDEVIVTGVQTTLPFDRWLVRDEAFRAADLSTGLVAERWEPVAREERRQALEIAAIAAASVATHAEAALRANGTTDGPRPSKAPASSWWTEGLAASVDRWPR